MKLNHVALWVVCTLGFLCADGQPPIIPLPKEYKAINDSFNLNSGVALVIAEAALADEGYYLQKELLKQTGITVAIQRTKSPRSIILQKSPAKKLITGSYNLNMSANEIAISAADDEGIFNGIISLLQLTASKKAINGSMNIAVWNIADEPLYPWRGLMLDESRHFFGKEKVKSLLDWMAFYKLNKFHWHLTDEPGWRLEIKKYPLLSLIGGIGNQTNPNAAAAFYTQEDIKEIIQYASERKIEVIPEIDMPGHARAANKAYPEFSGGGSEKYPDFTFDPGKEATYTYLTSILKEVNVLFPSKMIHLGGDEVSFGNQQWGKNTGIQKIMAANNLKNLKDVEDYFMKRMADSLYKLNSQFLAWDEMANLSLPTDKTIIFWWRHDKPGQLKMAVDKNYSVVLCPRIPLYFDFVQDSNHTVGRKWKGAYAGLENLYAFDATHFISKSKQGKVLGIQANVWTEVIATPQRLDYMIFPRISALAEAAWSEKRDYQNYLDRLKAHLILYRENQTFFYNPFIPVMTDEPLAISLPKIKRVWTN